MNGWKMEQEYLTKFDNQGHRIATVCSVVHYNTEDERQTYLNEGYIVIAEEDYQYYIGNYGMGDNGTGYIRDDKTGKPISAPPVLELSDPPVDEERLALYEAMAAQEARLDELEAAIKNLKGGE